MNPEKLVVSGASSDKVHRHGYHRFYQDYVDAALVRVGKEPASVVEIGVAGGESIDMWLRALPGWHYFGIDIHPKQSKENATMICADQGSLSQLDEVAKTIKDSNVQIINDDGSHIPDHQINTFNSLFAVLQPGGTYIVEDIEVSYWTRGFLYGYNANYGYSHVDSFIERTKTILDFVNWTCMNTESREKLTEIATRGGWNIDCLHQVKTIVFAQNCVIFTKHTAEDMPFLNDTYVFAHFI
jgi:hypothetical protein